MSDQERELTPEQEADVSRLLADARATGPMPADVAARLDRVLVGLSEERAEAAVARPLPGGSVVDLAARRRRRVASLLVAAAAVVVVGVGVGQLVGDRNASDSAGSGDGGDAVAEREQADGTTAGSPSPPLAAHPGESGGSESSAPPLATTVGQVSESSFVADANQLRRALPAISGDDGEFVLLNADQLPSDLVVHSRSFDCSAAPWGLGALVPVLYDGTPAVLAYRPPMGDSQVIDLLQCGTADIVKTATLPAG